MNAVRSELALAKHGALMLIELMACLRTLVEHSLRAKYSHQNASGQRSLLPTAIGTMWCAFSFVTSASRSARYQNPTTCTSKGTPYCWPLTCQPAAAEPSWPIQLETAGVRLSSFPDLTWVASCPPPHCW